MTGGHYMRLQAAFENPGGQIVPLNIRGVLMKIVVHNHSNQYALSRKQVEAIYSVLPSALWSKVSQFHLCDDQRNAEIFEYSQETRIVAFSFPVKQETTEVVEAAVRELLIGLARLKSGSKFYLSLKQTERESYAPFVTEWFSKCIAAATKK
jgi:hypothetical protein